MVWPTLPCSQAMHSVRWAGEHCRRGKAETLVCAEYEMTHIVHLQPYEEIHLHSRWCRVVVRSLRTKDRDSESAGWGKERNEHHDRESFAGHDGDEHDN